MSNKYDEAFGDVPQFLPGRGGLNGGGIFAGAEGLEEFKEAKTHFDENGQGLWIRTRCDNCGARQQVLASWSVLTYISNHQMPPEWYYDQQHGLVRPNRGCVKCQRILNVGLTPDECTRALKSGMEAGLVKPGQVAAASQQLAHKPAPRR